MKEKKRGQTEETERERKVRGNRERGQNDREGEG